MLYNDLKNLMAAATCVEQCVPRGMQLPVLIALMWQIMSLSAGQVLTYTGTDPNTSGLVPVVPSAPAIAYPATGIGDWFKWNTTSHVWE